MSRDNEYDNFVDLIHLMHRNYPEYPSTFGSCSICHNGHARGAYLCDECIANKMTAIVGDDNSPLVDLMMNNYRKFIRVKNKLLNIIKEKNVSDKDREIANSLACSMELREVFGEKDGRNTKQG